MLFTLFSTKHIINTFLWKLKLWRPNHLLIFCFLNFHKTCILGQLIFFWKLRNSNFIFTIVSPFYKKGIDDFENICGSGCYGIKSRDKTRDLFSNSYEIEHFKYILLPDNYYYSLENVFFTFNKVLLLFSSVSFILPVTVHVFVELEITEERICKLDMYSLWVFTDINATTLVLKHCLCCV